MIDKIGIIVPSYNSISSICKCIDSIIHQTYGDWKLIVVDDGSTDDSSNILDEYAKQDQRIHIIHQPNQGVSCARNTGIANIDTEYFVCIDSDDFIEKDYLESFVSAKKEYPEIRHIWCGFQTIEKITDKNPQKKILDEGNKYSIYKVSDYMELYNNWYTQMPWHRLYETQIVKENNILFDQNLSLGEDMLFNLEYLDVVKNDEILIINKPLYNYVISSENSLNNKYRDDLLSINEKINESLKNFLLKHAINEDSWRKYYNRVFYSYEGVMLNTFHKQNVMSITDKIQFNNMILNKLEFRTALEKRDCLINPFFYLAYKSKNYRNVLFVQKLIKIKNRIKR